MATELTESWRNYDSSQPHFQPGGHHSENYFNCDLHGEMTWFKISGPAGKYK